MEENKEFDIGRSDNKSGKGMGWYVVHTYSGYENKVKVSIENAIENRHLENEILEVRVPVREETDIKNGAKKTALRKMLPGYVLIHMDADNNDAWFVVRNTRGVTGFVGPGSKPVPLSEEEMAALDFNTTHEKISLDVAEGDSVIIITDTWKDRVGVVKKIDTGKQKITVNLEIFGRETPVEFSFAEVKKM